MCAGMHVHACAWAKPMALYFLELPFSCDAWRKRSGCVGAFACWEASFPTRHGFLVAAGSPPSIPALC